MERMHNEELSDVARLVEVTSDAVAICDADGTVAHVNRQMLSLGKIGREQVVGADIKDLLYSVSFERSMGHKVPFTADGSENTLMLKLADGSFIPVRVRAIELSGFALRRCADCQSASGNYSIQQVTRCRNHK